MSSSASSSVIVRCCAAWILLLAGLTSGQSVSLAPYTSTVAVFVNQSYFVSCKAPEADTIVWTKVGEGDIQATSGKIHVEEKTDESLDLVFETIKKKNQGEYVCKATYKGKEVTKNFTLSVFKPISFGDTEDVQFATEGLDFLIRCDVNGDEKVTRSWKVGGKALRPSNKRFQQQPNGLHIEQVTLEDGGLYVCRGTQTHPMISDFKEMNITLKIQHKPRWFKEHISAEEAYGFIGGTVNMTCSALAEPGAEFTWINDNKTLEPGDDVQIFNSLHHSTLQLYVYDESVFGDYECRATNKLGTMARVIVLEQASKPAVPTFKIKHVRQNSFELEIEDSDVVSDRGQDGHRMPMDVTGYVVQLKKTGADWAMAESREFERIIGKPYVVTGMQQDTSYEIRVAARTAAGTGDFSAGKIDKTIKLVATAAPIHNDGSLLLQQHWLLTLLIAALLSANICI